MLFAIVVIVRSIEDPFETTYDVAHVLRPLTTRTMKMEMAVGVFLSCCLCCCSVTISLLIYVNSLVTARVFVVGEDCSHVWW